MSLFLATFLPGVFLAVLGAVLCWNGAPVAAKARALPRSREAAWVLFVIAGDFIDLLRAAKTLKR